MLFTIHAYEKVNARSLNPIRTLRDWTELSIYDIGEKGRNHGIILETKAGHRRANRRSLPYDP